MKRKISFKGYFILALFLLAGVYVYSLQTTTNTQSKASDPITPTLYCLGACPTLPADPTTVVTPVTSLSVTNTITTVPSETVPTQRPRAVAPDKNSASVVQPCSTIENAAQTKKRKKQSGGFFEAFFEFLFRLIELILQLSGRQLPDPGCGNPGNPSVTPVVSLDPADPSDPSQMTRTCTTNLDQYPALMNTPAIAVAVVKNGKTVCTKASGLSNIANNTAATPDTTFLWASVSKTINAAAAMQLHDQGKLDLDADINEYLPFDVRNPSCATKPITVRQLLSHNASIRDNWQDVLTPLMVNGDSPITLRQFMQGYFTSGGAYYNATKNFQPSCTETVTEYSNVGASLAGYIVEIVSGKSFEAYTQDAIFKPLGMTQTSWTLAQTNRSNLATNYNGVTGSFVAVEPYGYPLKPSTTLRTSVVQLSKFNAMLAQKGTYNGQQILKPESVAEMEKFQFPQINNVYGMGMYLLTAGSFTNLRGHMGDYIGVSSIMSYDPATGVGVVIVGNGRFWDKQPAANNATFLEEELYKEAAKY